jgi:hypothetical protein
MKVYVVEVKLPPRLKRALRFIVPALVLCAAVTVAYAAVPVSFNPNTVLTADSLNKNFSNLDQRVGVLEGRSIITKNGHKYSVGATYCGKTAATNGQITNGYVGAKGLCESVAACGPSASAHMCTAEEITMSAQLGITVEPGWYSSATHPTYGTAHVDDCDGWTNNSTVDGTVWTAGKFPDTSTCSGTHPVLCCD